MNERVWTEAKLKAEELSAGVATALNRVGDDLPPAERTHIEKLHNDLRCALTSGEVSRLKRVTADLDRATEPVAALLLERALVQTGSST